MGRVRADARPLVVRRLLLVLSAALLLATGAAEAVVRPGQPAGATVGAAAVRAQPVPVRGETSSPPRAVLVRAEALAAVPAPAGPGAALPPGSRALVAPHLVADPQARPPADVPAGRTGDGAASRAPPAAAGT